MPGVVKISEAASIAIHALVLMAANPGQMLSAKEISETFGVSRAHLAKVLQRLAKAGLVSSSRGPAGGFKLAKPSQDVTLLDIYETMEGPLVETGCLLDREICPGGVCILGDAIAQINHQVRDTLAMRSLAELTRSYLLRSKSRPIQNIS